MPTVSVIKKALSMTEELTPIQRRRKKIQAQYAMEESGLVEVPNQRSWRKFITYFMASVFLMMIIVAIAGKFLQDALDRGIYQGGPIYYQSGGAPITKGEQIADMLELVVIYAGTVILFFVLKNKYLPKREDKSS